MVASIVFVSRFPGGFSWFSVAVILSFWSVSVVLLGLVGWWCGDVYWALVMAVFAACAESAIAGSVKSASDVDLSVWYLISPLILPFDFV